MAKHRKSLNGVLGVIIIPWYSIVSQKCEEFVSIFLEGGWTWGITSYAATFLIAMSTRLYDDTRRIHI